MKKIVFFVLSAVMLGFTACSSCGGNNVQPALVIESETDSLYMVNDSTIGDLQTFVFEGFMPTDDGFEGSTLLTVQTVDLNEDGSYTVHTNYVDGNGKQNATYDSGETIVLIGMPNDSTAVIYELVSYGNTPKTRLKMNSDSSFVKLNSKMQPASKDPKHILTHKKQ